MNTKYNPEDPVTLHPQSLLYRTRQCLRKSLNNACVLMCFLWILFGCSFLLMLVTEIGATIIRVIFDEFIRALHGIGILRSG
jgi:hypothetical protein